MRTPATIYGHPLGAQLLGYGAALISVLVVLFGYPLLGLPGSNVNFVPFMAAVAFSAWLGGLGPGLFATFLSVVLASYFYLPPVFSVEIGDPSTRTRIIVFVVAALIVNGIAYARSRAENRLTAERAQLEVTLASIGDAVIVTDNQVRVTFMNPMAESLTGWKERDATGQNVAQIFKVVDEQTRESVETPIAKVLRDGRVEGASSHVLLISKDGSEHPIEDSSAPIRATGDEITGVVLVFRDISERRAVDKDRDRLLNQVEYERRRLNDTLSNVPGVVWETWGKPDEAHQRIDFVSDYVESMLGYTVEEWLSTPNFWLTIVHPDDKEEASRRSAEQFSSGTGGTNRFRWVTKDGRILWAEANATVIKDEDGTPVGMRGVTMDLSERKQLEDLVSEQAEALRGEYERLASLIDNINVGLVLVDSDGRFSLANDRWLEQTGYKREDVIGKNPSDFYTDPRGDVTESMINKVLRSGEPIILREFFMQNANRPKGWYADWSLLPIRDSHGKTTGVLNALLDVTEKVKSRQEIEGQRATLRTIVEGTPIGLALIDREMRIVDLNAEWARMTGIDLATAKGRVMYEVNPSFEQRRAFYERVLSGESIELQNVPFTVGGEMDTHYRDIHLRPVRDPNGTITGMLNAVIDVTVRHLLDRQKDEFIAIASHELKTPITTIKGYTQLSLRAAEKSGDKSLARALTIVNERADRLARLINEMLDVSRLESGSLPLTKEQFDLTELVKEALVEAELTTPTFHFDITTGDNDLPVCADRQRIEQVITNLLQNAIKYSANSGKAEVTAQREGEEAVVAVRDHGMGIPAEQQKEVFKRFFRASNVAYTNYSGLGLGLYISHGIIERHGGRMWVESKEGEGSTFYFTLPLSEEK